MKESKQSIRTRKLISRAFLELMVEKSFEDITVTDICDKAMITRATFYKYFEDKFHLSQCVIVSIKEDVFDNNLQNYTFTSTKDLYLKLIELCFDYIKDHQKGFLAFIKHSYSDRLRIMIMQTIYDYIESITQQEASHFKYNIPTEIISKFVTGGFTYLMLFMIENNLKYSKEEVLKWTDEVLTSALIQK